MLAKFTFYRGKWGTGQPAAPVSAIEEPTVRELISKDYHMITFDGYMGLAVFTPTGIPIEREHIPVDNVHYDPIYDIMAYHKDEVQLISNAAARMSKFNSLYSGLDYIICIIGRDLRIANGIFYYNDGGHTAVSKYIKLITPFTALKRSGFTTGEITIDMIQLYAKTKHYVRIYDRNATTVIAQECDPDTIPDSKSHIIVSSRKAKYAENVNILRKLSHSGDNLYIYSCSNYGVMLPRIHTPHLELLRDILISSADVDIYLHADVIPAAEGDIRYDDDE